MTEAEAEELLRDWQEKLMLQHWEISLECDDDIPDNAQLSWCRNGQRATVTLDADREPEEIERSIVHELMHIPLRNLMVSVDRATGRLGDDATEIVDWAIESHEERAVDHLTRCILQFRNGEEDA